MTINRRYKLSFTTGSLYLSESIDIVGCYCEIKDWSEVQKLVITNNLLHQRTLSSSQKIYKEIESRISLLTQEQIQLLLTGNIQDKKNMLWLSICKKYEFIKDFAIDVIFTKFTSLEYELSYDDYSIFFNQKADWCVELEELSESTTKKLRQVLFRMLREADIIDGSRIIQTTFFSKKCIDVIKDDSQSWFQIFPINPLSGVQND